MPTFTTHLELGGDAFGVSGGIDPEVVTLTPGQVRIVRTHPKARPFPDSVCYVEEYMCKETGVGTGTIWTYGTNIFATLQEAHGGVLVARQRNHEQIAARDADRAKQAERERERDLAELERLKRQYEPPKEPK